MENNDAVELPIDAALHIEFVNCVLSSCFLRLRGPNHRDPCVFTTHHDGIHPAIRRDKCILDPDHLRQIPVNKLITKLSNLVYVT